MNEEPENINRRSFLKKIGTLAAGAFIAGPVLEAAGETFESNEDSKEKKEKERNLTKELFEGREILSNPGKKFKDKVDRLTKRNSGADTEYDALELMYKKRKNLPPKTTSQDLKEGWERLLSEDLETVLGIIKKHGLPVDIVFLALAESHWKKNAKSRAGAAGPWQFMKKTAQGFGMKVSSTVDERLDVKKSTEAACKYLKYLHSLAKGEQKISESDRWIWAFWAYNRGQGHIFGTKNKKGDFSRAKGDPNKYFDICDNKESRDYAPNIFAVAEALEKFAVEKEIPPAPEASPISEADKLFQQYYGTSFADSTGQIVFLENIIDKYHEEGKEGIHTAPYIDDVTDFVHDEILEIKNKKESEEIKESKESKEGILTIIYTIKEGDNLDKIITWLSPSPEKVSTVSRFIKKLNPKIKNWDNLYADQEIIVPGNLATVSSMGIDEILEIYYPGIDPSEAIKYLNELNGINSSNKIRSGDDIFVPLSEEDLK